MTTVTKSRAIMVRALVGPLPVCSCITCTVRVEIADATSPRPLSAVGSCIDAFLSPSRLGAARKAEERGEPDGDLPSVAPITFPNALLLGDRQPRASPTPESRRQRWS